MIIIQAVVFVKKVNYLLFNVIDKKNLRITVIAKPMNL